MAGRLRRTVAALSLVVLLLPLAGATSLAAKPIEVFKSRAAATRRSPKQARAATPWTTS